MPPAAPLLRGRLVVRGPDRASHRVESGHRSTELRARTTHALAPHLAPLVLPSVHSPRLASSWCPHHFCHVPESDRLVRRTPFHGHTLASGLPPRARGTQGLG